MTRLRKVLRDIVQERGRALLVLAALVVGQWGVASVIASTTVLAREIHGNYAVTNPRHATLTYRGDGDAAAAARTARWVTDAEWRTTISARAKGGFDGRLPVNLILADDFERQRIATFQLQSGRWPEAGEIALERDDLTVLGLAAPPDALELSLPGGEWRRLPISGVVHDAGQAPARMEHALYVYAPRETALALGADLAQQAIVVRMAAPAVQNRPLAQAHAELLGEELEKQGFEIVRVDAPEPEEHPHAGQMGTMLFVQLAFGGLALALSGIVVVLMISSLMQRHVVQIGVLKALGATPGQVGALYLLMVLVLSLAALAITLPLGFTSGLRYADYVIAQLNFERLSPSAPLRGLVAFVSVSLLLPQLAALFPVVRGMRVTVRDALRAGGADAPGRLATTRALPIPFRDAARRPARTALTVLTLTVGLAALAAAYHVGASLRETMEFTTRNRPYDLAMVFAEPVDRARLEPAFAKLDGAIASWSPTVGGSAAVVKDGRPGDPFPVLAADPLEPQRAVVAGAWRLPPEGRAIVVHSRFAADESVGVGDVLTLRMNGEDSRWPVGAIVRTIGSSGCYLLSAEPLPFDGIRGATATLLPPTKEALEQASNARISLGHGGHGSHAPALEKAVAKYQASVVRRLEQDLEEQGVPVRMGVTKAELVAGLEDHVYVMTRQLALAALVILAIGGLGLASAMSVSVLERTREIGVLRSLGATPARLARIFASEGAAIGALSLTLGALVSLPLGRAIADYFGHLMFKTPLEVGRSIAGVAYGAGIVGVLVVLVALVALLQTMRQSATEALRHE